ncbi:MAG: family 10 glycosylhydrolase [Bacteroidota bacterium]|nr:family 10 glycosylhydrolase [Bacteroidota bacterium]
MKSAFFILSTLLLLYAQPAQSQVAPKFEMRGVWVATVENIDWPSRKGLPVDQQKAEFIQLLDMHKHNGINAVFVQVRPAGDAFYPSQYEPWSEYLTGRQGLPPTPYYDPLQFMIEETHKRGMEFHAWLNPYRAVFNMHSSSVAPSHVTKIHPEWFLVYGGKKYFNPGLPEVRNHVNRIVKDLVTRYDIDGIHMDDYFYPYRITGKEFPDEATYRKYGKGLGKDDWRRSNCDSIILQLHNTIQSIKPRVKFGISPFGVWRNKSQDPEGSDTRAGQTCYDDLYANILLWLKEGWIDYVAPQLYWERGHKLCDYDVLLDWWNKHTYGRHLYIGHAVYRAGSNTAWRNKEEIPEEIKDLRTYSTTQGSIYFSSKNFESNPNGWSDSLHRNYYALPALVPPMPWIDSIPPAAPVVEKNKNGQFAITYNGEEKIKGFAILDLPELVDVKFEYVTMIDIITSDKTALFDRSKSIATPKDRLFVCAIDLNNNLSKAVELVP